MLATFWYIKHVYYISKLHFGHEPIDEKKNPYFCTAFMLLLPGFLKFSISEGIFVIKPPIFNKSLEEEFSFTMGGRTTLNNIFKTYTNF